MTQLPGLVVTVCSSRHTQISLSGIVHITVIGATRTSLLLVLYAHHCYWSPITDITFLSSILFQPFLKWFLFAIIYVASVLKNYMLLLPKIIATVFEMVFDGYYMNSNRIIALEFLKYTFMKYFEIFPPKILLKINIL